MNIFIFGGNWQNRGDESAIRAMIDELKIIYPESNIRIHVNNGPLHQFAYNDIVYVEKFYRPGKKNILLSLLYEIFIISNGKINLLYGELKKRADFFMKTLKWSDIILYAPGGPMIGDLYKAGSLINCFKLIINSKKPYAFFAPSMGPFTKNKGIIRRILNNSKLICLRESISKEYVQSLNINKEPIVTLDSAFQHSIDLEYNESLLKKYTELNNFLKNKKVIGVTITDLQWHKSYKDNQISENIKRTFKKTIQHLHDMGYAILFIPQLFGTANDKDYMDSFAIDNCFTMSDEYDCYFQQYVISKLYCVIGMRYHSNIFSAKMGTPFISVAYEQKMEGFMKKANLFDYCIMINELNSDNLISKFNLLVSNYDSYKEQLIMDSKKYMSESHKTTELVSELIDNLINKNN